MAGFTSTSSKVTMSKVVSGLLIIASCLLLFGQAAAHEVGDFLGRRVTTVNIVIEGVTSGGSTEMRALLEVATGQDYSPVRIRDSLGRLYRSGLISGARVEAQAVGADGVAITFIVRPQARIDSVTFEGNAGFAPGELRARLNQLDPGARFSVAAVNRGVGDLLAFYTSRGYYQAKVTSDVQLDPTGTRATVVYRVAPGEQARVSRFIVDIKGEQIDLTKVTHAIKEGQVFTQASVQQEIDSLRDAYLKQDYLAAQITSNIATDMVSNTVAITIAGSSGPRVLIGVKGIPLDEKKKREILPVYQRGGVDEFSLEEGRRRLQDYVQRKGYFFAEIARPDVPDLSAREVSLDYVVNTGPRLKLSDIDITGLEAIPSQTLQDELKSKEASFIPVFGLNRGITSNDMLRQDSNLILKRLREIGYRRAQIEVLRGVSPTGDKLIITFNVAQGPRTFIEQVDLRGNNVLTTTDLRDRLTINPLDPLVTSQVSQNVDKLVSAYNTQGYATTEIVSELVDLGSVDGQDRARLVYNVNEGNRVRIQNINTRGLGVTEVGRLERNFYLFKEGEFLKIEDLQETERELYETDAFRSISITSEPVGTTPDGIELRDVTVDVAEAKRYQLITGLGYQTNNSDLVVPGLGFLNGLRGLAQLTNTNMFGKLYTGSMQVRASQNELLGNISFQNPRPFGNNYPTLISIFARRLAERSFNSDRYTALIQTERRLSPQTIAYLTYNFERISNYNLRVSLTEIERNRQAVRLGRIGPSFLRDTRNNRFDPTDGTLTLGSFYYASSFLGGNEAFLKSLVEHNRYYPVPKFRDTVYTVSGRLGLATPLGGKDSLPISERFFAGGARDLRGFGFEEAGPRELATFRDVDGNVTTRLQPTGGNAVIVINNELRFPIYRILGGTLFSDTGNVFERVRDISLGELTQTVGFGFRLKTPVGPVRFDIGFLVLNGPRDLPRHRYHFSIGNTF